MKKIIAGIMAALMITFSGCALINDDRVKQVSSVVLNGPILIADIEKVYEDLAKLQEEKQIYSEEDIEVLRDSMSVYEIVKTEYETLLALEIVPSTEDAMVMWKQARTAYSNAMKVIESKRDMYPTSVRINIDVMDAHAKRADIDVMALLSDPTTGNITEALKIIGGLVQIGTKVAVLL